MGWCVACARLRALANTGEGNARFEINLHAFPGVLQDVTVSGDGVDFDGFFVDQYPRLLAIGLAWSIDRETAADLAQEAMARALSDWGRVSCLASPGGWTARVMTNLLIDAHRASRRRERVPLRPVMDDRLVPVGITDDDWRAALHGLPPAS
jgi:DNA-directed RNA polymerase specialized sigma24 family protein